MNNWLHSAHVSKQQSRQEPKCSNTSTDVEKTGMQLPLREFKQKHIHGRGEDLPGRTRQRRPPETPPRTWRRRIHGRIRIAEVGNTSTDVEKTWSNPDRRSPQEKHLHGRGEDEKRYCPACGAEETPPRTWRRPSNSSQSSFADRNTSTDVEKTLFLACPSPCGQKHLHGRGEDS